MEPELRLEQLRSHSRLLAQCLGSSLTWRWHSGPCGAASACSVCCGVSFRRRAMCTQMSSSSPLRSWRVSSLCAVRISCHRVWTIADWMFSGEGETCLCGRVVIPWASLEWELGSGDFASPPWLVTLIFWMIFWMPASDVFLLGPIAQVILNESSFVLFSGEILELGFPDA